MVLFVNSISLFVLYSHWHWQFHHFSCIFFSSTVRCCVLSAINKSITYLLTYLHQAEWQTRWHNPPYWGLVSSVDTCLALWSVIQQRVYEWDQSSWHWWAATASTACVARLGAVADWWCSWSMANALVFVPVADIFNILRDYQFVFSEIDELCVSHHAWCSV